MAGREVCRSRVIIAICHFSFVKTIQPTLQLGGWRWLPLPLHCLAPCLPDQKKGCGLWSQGMGNAAPGGSQHEQEWEPVISTSALGCNQVQRPGVRDYGLTTAFSAKWSAYSRGWDLIVFSFLSVFSVSPNNSVPGEMYASMHTSTPTSNVAYVVVLKSFH